MTDSPQNHEAWLKQVAVPCPMCGVAATEPCFRIERGVPIEIRGTHKARKAAAT